MGKYCGTLLQLGRSYKINMSILSHTQILSEETRLLKWWASNKLAGLHTEFFFLGRRGGGGGGGGN